MTAPADSRKGEADVSRLLISAERLLVNEAAEKLKERLIPREAIDLNYLSVYGWDAQLGPVLEFLQTMPFLADRRLLVIREIQEFSDWKKLLEYIKDPNPLSFLLLTSSEMDKKSAVYRSLSGLMEVSELRRPYGKALAGWVVKRFRSAGKEISPELAGMLVEISGTVLGTLAMEVEKVSLFAGDRDTITRDDLNASLPGGVETVFSFLDALGEGKKSQAVVCLKRLLESGAPPGFLVYMTAAHYRKLMVGKELVGTGLRPAQAAVKVGIRYPNLQEKFVRQLRRAKERDLEEDLKSLSVCDRNLKTGSLPDRVLMDKLLLDLLA